jgi:asparagine synthase (glutamine-hydrolysing)
VQHLRGMFAFAIWNRNTKTLFIARDRLGIKPLYYKLTPERLLFGSEIKVVLAHGGIRPEFNRAALPEYPGVWIFVGRGKFLLRNSQAAARAHDDDWSGGKADIRQYWDLDASKPHESRDEVITSRVIASCWKARSTAT